jgi:S1-C subfamily serine protease
MFSDLTDKERKEYGQNTGVIIQTVIENSPAFLANIINGDLILKFDNNDVVNTNSLMKLIGDKKLGEKVSFTLIRNGKVIDISLITSDSYN